MRDEIIKAINSAISEYGEINKINDMWREPVIEIISANDEKIKGLKQVVSLEHLMPHDILQDAKSAINFLFCFMKE